MNNIKVEDNNKNVDINENSSINNSELDSINNSVGEEYTIEMYNNW
jgi:hypothetical protein